MTNPLRSIPVPTTGGTTGDSTWAQTWTLLTDLASAIPGWVITTTTLTLIAATIGTLHWARKAAWRAGARRAGRITDPATRKDRALFGTALTFAGLFWIAVHIGSGRGLIAFGTDDLHWTDGWQYLVPATLDGVGIAFALLAFRALLKGFNPDRCLRIAGLSMLASAGINFLHEVGGSSLGAVYLAILSMLGLLILHEILNQFEQGTDWIRRQNPKFGLRWLTWPTNTVCAWFAWRNRPPAHGLRATIGNAVAHLEQVRAEKALKRAAFVDRPAWWMRLAPWVRNMQLATSLEASRAVAAQHRALTDKRHAELTARVDQLTGELTAAVNRATAVSSDLDAVKAELDLAGKRYDEAEESHRKALAEQAERLTVEGDEKANRLTAQLRAELTAKPDRAKPVNLTDWRSSRPSKPAAGSTGKAEISDEAAVQAMLTAHPDPAHEWSKNAVRTLLGVGLARAPRLIELWFTAATGKATGEVTGSGEAVNQ